MSAAEETDKTSRDLNAADRAFIAALAHNPPYYDLAQSVLNLDTNVFILEKNILQRLIRPTTRSGAKFFKQTPLIAAIELAARYPEMVQVAIALLQFGADPNEKDEQNYTAMRTLAWTREIEEPGIRNLMQVLLEKKAVVEDKKMHVTPLQTAAIISNHVMVKLLLEAGADVNRADFLQRTPLMLAIEYGVHDKEKTPYEALIVIKALLEKGADLRCVSYKGDIIRLIRQSDTKAKDIEKLVLKFVQDRNLKDALNGVQQNVRAAVPPVFKKRSGP